MIPTHPCIGSLTLSHWTTREGPEEEQIKEKEGAQGDEEEGASLSFTFWFLFLSSENLLHDFNFNLEIG